VIVGVSVLVGVSVGMGVAVLVAVGVAVWVAVMIAVVWKTSVRSFGVGYRGSVLKQPVDSVRQRVAKMIPLTRFICKIIPILGVNLATKAHS
jgi:hypothetical protein